MPQTEHRERPVFVHSRLQLCRLVRGQLAVRHCLVDYVELRVRHRRCQCLRSDPQLLRRQRDELVAWAIAVTSLGECAVYCEYGHPSNKGGRNHPQNSSHCNSPLCLVDSRLSDALCHMVGDRKSTRLNSSHGYISYAVFCLKKKT